MAQVEAERERVKNAAPSVQSYEKLPALDLTNPEHRSKFRTLLHDLIDRIVMDVAAKRYEIVFKTGKKLAVSCGAAGTWMLME